MGRCLHFCAHEKQVFPGAQRSKFEVKIRRAAVGSENVTPSKRVSLDTLRNKLLSPREKNK